MVNRPFAIEAAVSGAGGLSKLAAAIGVTPSAINQWDVVPPLRVLKVEQASGIPRWVLRPDMYQRPGAQQAPGFIINTTHDGTTVVFDPETGKSASGRTADEAMADLRRLLSERQAA